MNKVAEREKTLLPRFVLKEESTHILSVRVDENGKLLLDHYHSISLTSGSGGGNHKHSYGAYSDHINCGSGSYHHHYYNCNYTNPGTHKHSVSGNTGDTESSDLNHTHSISLTTGSGTMPSHTHTPGTHKTGGYCDVCGSGNVHVHSVSGQSASGGGSHTHSVSGNTGTGEGTTDSHRHPISITSSNWSHYHLLTTITFEPATCGGGYYHNHEGKGNSGSTAHSHSVSGYTGYAACEPANQPPTPPTSLLCEGQTNLHGVTDTTPEFSAILNDPDSGDILTHVWIQVNTASDFTGTMMWDSGWIDITDVTEGSRCENIVYAGTPLSRDGSKYWWRIKAKDDSGTEGEWSTEETYFEMLKEVSLSDLGVGSDSIVGLACRFSLQDSGAGTDSISKIEKLYKLVSDWGMGGDILSPLVKISAQDSGAGAELLSLLARLSLQDSGSGVDLLSLVQKTFRSVSDSGTGQDLITSILVQLVISDSASASEVLSSLAKLSVSDAGVGIDTVLGQFQKIVADSGSGVDILTAFVEVLVQEAGQGIEAILRRASYQYKGGTVALVKGSPIVIGTGTSWLGQVRAGDLFKVKGENALYVVSSVESDTELTLSSNYVGESRTNVSYIIHRFFTANYLLPLLTGKTGEYEGDEDWSELYKYAIRKIDKLLKNLGA